MHRAAASLIVHCYPSVWREIYGDEFAALLETQPRSPQLLADVVRGVADAWLRPQIGGELMTLDWNRPALRLPAAWLALAVIVATIAVQGFGLVYALNLANGLDRVIETAVRAPAGGALVMPFINTFKLLAIGGPALSLLLGVAPVLRISIDRSGDSLSGTVSIHQARLNGLVIVVSILLGISLVAITWLSHNGGCLTSGSPLAIAGCLLD